MKKNGALKTWLLCIVLVLLMSVGFFNVFKYIGNRTSQTAAAATPSAPAETSTPVPSATAETIPASAFTDPDSLLLLANKKHKLPSGYQPSDLVAVTIRTSNGTCQLRSEASEALTKMNAAAQADGVTLMISSAFRDEAYQTSLYNNYVAKYGVASADTFSSRPGYSDHQTGLAMDFVEGSAADFTDDFESTASGQWLAANAHLYGFIMRYPKGKQDITGYDYEPWHFRYVGVDYATSIYSTDPTESFEEYFRVTGGDYSS